MRRMVVIANPVAGRRDRGPLLEAIVRGLADRGITAEVQATRGPGDATRLAAAVPDGTAAVIAVGGDGTVTEVAEGLRGRDLPLALVPAGTANVLAKELRLPRRLARRLDVIAAGRVRRLDGGLLNGRRFLLMVGVGFDSEVVARHLRHTSGHNSFLAYVWPIVAAFFTARLPGLSVKVDGTALPGEFTEVVAGNARCFGGFFEVTSRARPDDGQLDVTALRGRNRLRWLGYLALGMLRQLHRAPGAASARGTRIEISAATPVPVQRDGDPAGFTPCDIRLEPGAVPVIVP